MQPRSAEAAHAMANGWEYLDEHRGRPHDRQLRRGGMASSNTFMCHGRLKRSGAWWYEVNSHRMLALRCAKYNGTFERVFTRHQHRLREA